MRADWTPVCIFKSRPTLQDSISINPIYRRSGTESRSAVDGDERKMMAFEDGFTQTLTDAGISIDASVIPAQDAAAADLDTLISWFSSLEPDTLEALDRVAAENPVKAGLADPSVGIAPSLAAVFSALDETPAAFSITATVDLLRQAFDAGVAQA